ncbi:MAG: hypothetical protein QOF76_2440, partial [Solirubrobacteraceae bacterium]|nr:hypothetical protein [Solirubrobacteraceae bacterium]
VVTPTVCAPCTFTLNARLGAAAGVPDGAGGTTQPAVSFSDTRLAYVDLGPVQP